MRKSFLFVILFSSFTATAVTPKKIGRLARPLVFNSPACQSRPSFAVEQKKTELTKGLQELPESVFVARDVEMWVESAQNKIQVHTYQSFLNKDRRHQADVICAVSPLNYSDRFSMSAPTLIDKTKEAKTGQSIWQFQAIIDQQGYSVWNRKNHLDSKKSKDLESFIASEGLTYKLYQLSKTEYEIILQKENAGALQTLSIRYEMIK